MRICLNSTILYMNENIDSPASINIKILKWKPFVKKNNKADVYIFLTFALEAFSF